MSVFGAIYDQIRGPEHNEHALDLSFALPGEDMTEVLALEDRMRAELEEPGLATVSGYVVDPESGQVVIRIFTTDPEATESRVRPLMQSVHVLAGAELIRRD